MAYRQPDDELTITVRFYSKAEWGCVEMTAGSRDWGENYIFKNW